MLSLIQDKHKAPNLINSLKIFINGLQSQPLSQRDLAEVGLPFSRLDVYNMLHITPTSLNDDNAAEKDTIKAFPVSPQNPFGRFDTVIVMVNDKAESTGLIGMVYYPI